MATHALFLRGINVAGITVPMRELRACLTDAGLADVATHLQTGNVTFSSDADPAGLVPAVERAIGERFGYEAHVLLFTRDELADAVAAYPFAPRDDHHRYAILCDTDATAAELAARAAEVDAEAEVTASGRVVHWACPKGSTLGSAFGKELARRRWKAATTTRNLNTLEKMLA